MIRSTYIVDVIFEMVASMFLLGNQRVRSANVGLVDIE